MFDVVVTMDRDIAHLDMRLLQAFEALAIERNVTRAAERIGMTQQGLSGQLARLRTLFDDPLFVRAKGGVAPTPRAEELAPAIRDVLSHLEALVTPESFDPAAFEGVVTIAATDYALALILPALLGRLRVEAPGLRIVIRPADAATLASDMQEARIDIALIVPQFAPPGLHSERLFDERYVGVARIGHPAIVDGAVSLDEFCAYPHLLVSPFRGDALGPTDLALASIGRRRTIGLVVPSFSVVGALLLQTDLIAVLPDRLIGVMRHELSTFETPVPVDGFTLVAVWPPRLHRSALHSWLRDEIGQAAESCRAQTRPPQLAQPE
jgi:DNA-binding transcriptional LysR family regulator